MFFKLRNSYKDLSKLGVLYNLSKYKVKLSDKPLEVFLKKKYKKSLKEICVDLINDATWNVEPQDEHLVITFKTKEEDNLASFITYGNIQIQGSNILKEVFYGV